MNVEEFVISYLGSKLDVPVSGDVPDLSTTPCFVTVEKTGSRLKDRLYLATLAVQSWAESRVEAAALNEAVKTAMQAAVELPEVSRCALLNDYNYAAITQKRPRYQAVFEVLYYERS